MKNNDNHLRLQLNFISRVPHSEQVTEILRKAINYRKLLNNTRMPSIKKIAHENLISQVAIAEAYRKLEAEGLLKWDKDIGGFLVNL